MANNNGNKVLNAPPLRFPEFSGEWERIKVSDLLDFYPTNSLAWESLNYEKGEIKNLHYGLIHKGLPTLADTKVDNLPFINEANIPRKYTLCKCGDVAFADASEDTNEVGKAVEIFQLGNDKVVCGLHTIHGRDKSGCTMSGFKGYAFNSMAFHYQMRRIAQGTKIYSINTRNFEETYIGIPSKEEQSKIAKLLALIDKRIATQIGLIEDLKKLKSAITEKLYKEIKGGRYSYRQLFSIVNERNKKLAFTNILSASQELGMVEREDLNLDIKFERNNITTYKIVRKGDYVIHLRSFQGGFAFSETNGVCSPAYTILRPSNLLEYGYLSFYFTSKSFVNSLRLVTYGIRDGRSINVDEWLDMKVTLPTLNEQKRILSIIGSIDKKLSNESAILSNMNLQRQYLLRMMFV